MVSSSPFVLGRKLRTLGFSRHTRYPSSCSIGGPLFGLSSSSEHHRRPAAFAYHRRHVAAKAPLRVSSPSALSAVGACSRRVCLTRHAARRVSHPLGGLLLPRPFSHVSGRWRSWGSVPVPTPKRSRLKSVHVLCPGFPLQGSLSSGLGQRATAASFHGFSSAFGSTPRQKRPFEVSLTRRAASGSRKSPPTLMRFSVWFQLLVREGLLVPIAVGFPLDLPKDVSAFPSISSQHLGAPT